MKITHKFKIKNSAKNQRLHETIDICADIWNFCVELLREDYAEHGKIRSKFDLQKELTRLKKLKKHSLWNKVGSQAIQDITDRIYRSHQQCSRKKKEGKKASRPRLKSEEQYKSFTLKQAGYKFQEGKKVRIGKTVYKFYKSREISGKINTVTIKRDGLGDLYLCITCTVEDVPVTIPTTSSNIVGIDFGMITFLTLSDGTRYESSLHYTNALIELRKASKEFSTKQKNSNNERRYYLTLVRAHKKVVNKRHDDFHKLAKELAEKYDAICIEDLNIAAMKQLWGRKISDLAFSEFVAILKHHCNKAGIPLVVIDRFYPSSKQCHKCLAINKNLSLEDREWTCPNCNALLDRDLNAAINIRRVGSATLGLSDIRPASPLAITD